MSHLITQLSQSRRQRIKKFESRVVNRSWADLRIYEKLADRMLDCSSQEIKPNTLSVCSLIPLVIANVVIAPGEFWSFIVGIFAILLHQVFDIANKKQAYRLTMFNLSMYYIDHLYDSLSSVLIVDMTCRLLMLDNQTRITCLFFFAMLPFYTHHLAMYANGYLTFTSFSPAVQGTLSYFYHLGLLLLKLLFIACAVLPQLPTLVVAGIKINQILVWVCAIWLVIFLIDDIKTISNMKNDVHQSNLPSESTPVKNLFVIGVVGYIMMETTIVEPYLLKNQLLFTLCISILSLLFTLLISELILSYGFEEKHRQFTLNTLLTLFWVVLYYSICGLVNLEAELELLMGQVLFGVVLLVELGYFFYYHYSNVKYLNGVLSEE